MKVSTLTAGPIKKELWQPSKSNVTGAAQSVLLSQAPGDDEVLGGVEEVEDDRPGLNFFLKDDLNELQD